MPTLQHIGFIMDGNRRWARAQGLPPEVGHRQGFDRLHEVIDTSFDAGATTLSFYALSTENLTKRSPAELQHLFTLFAEFKKHLDLCHQQQIRVHHLGHTRGLPLSVTTTLSLLTSQTQHYTDRHLCLALNYGSHDELHRAALRYTSPDQSFPQLLDTGHLPPLDLVVRTGGRHRLSNFMLYQAAYAELYFTPTLWPDFDQSATQQAIDWYHQQTRTLGQ